MFLGDGEMKTVSLALWVLFSSAFVSGYSNASVHNNNSAIAINLSEPVRYQTSTPYINELKRAEVLTQSASAWNTDELGVVDFDDHGWPKSLTPVSGSADFDRVSFLLFGGDYSGWDIPPPEGGVFTVLYEGEGSLDYRLGVQKIGECGSKCDLVEISPANGIAIISIMSTDPAENGNYLRNIEVIHPGGICNGNTLEWVESSNQCGGVYTPLTSLRETQTYHPKFLSELKHYAGFRYMDTTFGNHMPIDNWAPQADFLALPLKDWASRSQLQDSVWSDKDKAGAPIEALVELSNSLDAAPWFTVPVLASDDYVAQYAALVRDQLDSGLSVYLEYGNEIWNGAFPAGTWIQHKGTEYWPEENGWAARLNYFAKRTVEVCEQWKEVWADEADRVHCVMGGWSANAWTTENVLLDCPLWSGDDRNPHKVAGKVCSDQIDAVAIAPYFGYYIGNESNQSKLTEWLDLGKEGLDLLFEEIRVGGKLDNSPTGGALAESIAEMRGQKTVVENAGLELLAYESGQHLVGTGAALWNANVAEFFKRANRDYRMQEVYTDYLKHWKTEEGGLLTIYSAFGPSSNYGSWGVKEYQGQTPSPKQLGIARFMAHNSCWWNGCEITPPPVDSDLDGITDISDNCIGVANIDQYDSNSDGYGTVCDPDLDGDQMTTMQDLDLLKSFFYTAEPDADFDRNGRVNFSDLATFKSYFGQPPGLSSADGG